MTGSWVNKSGVCLNFVTCPVCGHLCDQRQSYMQANAMVRLFYCKLHGEFNTVQRLNKNTPKNRRNNKP